MKQLKSILAIVLTFVVLAAVFTGCGPSPSSASSSAATEPSSSASSASESTTSEAKENDEKYVIGYAQTHMNTPWRSKQTNDLIAEAAARGWELIVTDAQGDTNTQINNVYDLMATGVDVMLMAPLQSDPLTPVAGEVMDAGIPLVLYDRTISNDNYTAFIGGDNTAAGETVGQWIVDHFGTDDEVIVVEMQGTLGASAYTERHTGFRNILDQYDNIKIVSDQSADGLRDDAMRLMENVLQANDHIDALFCHNDNMALGAIEAIEAAGRTGEIAVFGMDGQQIVCDEILAGRMTGTVYYPTGATETLDLVEKILNGEPFENHQLWDTPLIVAENVNEWYDRCF